MPTNTVKASDIQVVPFFARFLEVQSASKDKDKDKNKDTDTPTLPPPPPFTIKYPSDFEDR